MNLSECDRLSNPNLGMEKKSVSFGEFALTIGSEMTIPKEIKQSFERFLNGNFIEAHRRSSQEHMTVFQANTGLPSPIVRIDAASIVDPNRPENSIFEVEARPAGLGILTSMLGVVEPIKDVFRRIEKITSMPVGCGVLPSVTGATGNRDRSIDTLLLAQSANLPYLYQPW